MFTLQELLNLKSELFANSRVKLVRHKDNRVEYRDLIKDRDELLRYQSEQNSDVFRDCDIIISFIGLERSTAVLFGVFRVNGVESVNDEFHYSLTQLDQFNYLSNRVIIDWGASAISWHQWYNNTKEVLQILPQGYIGNFPGLLNFVLEFEELNRLINNPDANMDWKNQLSAVNGIYLILDSKTGEQYIGSANGKEGIWQRWREYSMTIHGGNNGLKKLCDSEVNYHKYFRYSILQSLPSNITQREIVRIENIYKEKLGTRAHGLNDN